MGIITHIRELAMCAACSSVPETLAPWLCKVVQRLRESGIALRLSIELHVLSQLEVAHLGPEHGHLLNGIEPSPGTCQKLVEVTITFGTDVPQRGARHI